MKDDVVSVRSQCSGASSNTTSSLSITEVSPSKVNHTDEPGISSENQHQEHTSNKDNKTTDIIIDDVPDSERLHNTEITPQDEENSTNENNNGNTKTNSNISNEEDGQTNLTSPSQPKNPGKDQSSDKRKKSKKMKKKPEYCYENGCRFSRCDRPPMIQCMLCFTYYHYECTKDDEELLKMCQIFVCPLCRNIAEKVSDIHGDVTVLSTSIDKASLRSIKSSMDAVRTHCSKFTTDMKKPLTEMTTSITKLQTAINEYKNEIVNLCGTVKQLETKLETTERTISNLTTKDGACASENQVTKCAKATKSQQEFTGSTLLIGDFTVQDLELCESSDRLCIPHGTSSELLAFLKVKNASQNPQTYDRAIISTGSNDCKQSEPLLDTIKAIEDLITEAKVCSKTVIVSSICPRLDDDNAQDKISFLNQELTEIVSIHGCQLVNNDTKFLTSDNEINRALIDRDTGYQLSEWGCEILARNLNLRGKTHIEKKTDSTHVKDMGNNHENKEWKTVSKSSKKSREPKSDKQGKCTNNLKESVTIDKSAHKGGVFPREKNAQQSDRERIRNKERHAPRKPEPTMKNKVWEEDPVHHISKRHSTHNSEKYDQNRSMQHNLKKYSSDNDSRNRSHYDQEERYRYHHQRTHTNHYMENDFEFEGTKWDSPQRIREYGSHEHHNYSDKETEYDNDWRSYHKRRNRHTYQDSGHVTKQIRCWFCAETGHSKDSCWHQRPVRCGTCNRLGHKSKMCGLL